MTTIHTARQLLQEISERLPMLSDAVQAALGLHSPKPSLAHGAKSHGLPFGLANAIDTTDDGYTGIRTPEGALAILQSWADSISEDRQETVHPTVIAYLHTTLDWAHDHADWDALCETITGVHHVISRVTGHAPHVIGRCECGGTISTDPTTSGIPDHGTCDRCDKWYADTRAIARTLKRAHDQAMRSTTIDPSITVTRDELTRIWGGQITKDDIKNWTRTGRLHLSDSKPRTLNLQAANQLAHQLTQKRHSAA